MSSCTFFGHRSIPEEVKSTLRSTLTDLIENHSVDIFYVGNHGGFDTMVRKVLSELSDQYAVTYYVVLAYMPAKRSNSDYTDYTETLLPVGIETVPKRFAITYRNKWMIQHADYVVTYVTSGIASGAAQFKQYAEKHGKNVIELSRETTTETK